MHGREGTHSPERFIDIFLNLRLSSSRALGQCRRLGVLLLVQIPTRASASACTPLARRARVYLSCVVVRHQHRPPNTAASRTEGRNSGSGGS